MPVVHEDYVKRAEEYDKNPGLIKEDYARLREWLATQKHLPEVKDEMLILFHHSCYYDLARTKDCIEAYYTMRTNTPEFFTNRDVTSPELAKSLDVYHIVDMPGTDSRGYRIFYNGLKDTDPTKFVYAEGVKLMLMALDVSLIRTGPVPGVVVIINQEGSKLGHLARISIATLRKFIAYTQDANPVRLMEIHILNVASWLDKLLFLARPFIKKELLSLLHFHSSGMESLYKFIPKECLPKELGGMQDSLDTMHDECVKNLTSMREFFVDDEKVRVDESKRESKSKKDTKLEARFSNLEID